MRQNLSRKVENENVNCVKTTFIDPKANQMRHQNDDLNTFLNRNTLNALKKVGKVDNLTKSDNNDTPNVKFDKNVEINDTFSKNPENLSSSSYLDKINKEKIIESEKSDINHHF